jgi:hypothetical protein
MTSTFDMMVAFIILVTAVGVFTASGISFLGSVSAEDTSKKLAAHRAADRLADDLLVDEPMADSLDTTCTRKFFQKDTSTCGFDSSWTTGSGDYLENVFELSNTNIHVRIVDTSGSPAVVSGTTLTLGDTIPSSDDTVYKWERHVALDADGDSTLEWHTLKVYIW